MYLSLRTSVGFTLIEVMIVIAMIAILLGSGMFPFSYYMERAKTEKAIDGITGEWIMAHQDVRGGILHDGGPSHAHMFIEMNTGDNFITLFTATGVLGPKKEYKKYTFDRGIEILEFTGSIMDSSPSLIYHMTPPFATGSFSTGGSTEVSLTGVIMTVGYPGASRESRRARDILLRSYFD